MVGRLWAVVALVLVVWAGSALAQAPAGKAPDTPLTIAIETDITLNPDRTSLTRHTARIGVRTAAGARTASQQTLSFIEGLETLEVIDAFTEKPGGRRIDLDRSKITIRNSALSGDGDAAADSRQMTLSFSDVSVGDTVVLTTVRAVAVPPFDGHFSHAAVFPRSQAWTSVRQTVTAPRSIPLNVAMRGAGVAMETLNSDELVSHRFSYRPSGPVVTEEQGAVAASDREPGFAISTFTGYEEFGARYWRGIAGAAGPSAGIAELAEEITRGIEDRRGQAEAVEIWVKRNIRSAGPALGTTRWASTSASRTLAVRSGDARDKAVLTAALLSARGIDSEQVLVNLGASYSLSQVPPGHFNHVMLRIPELDLYTDPSATAAAFGVLSAQTYDKPVLLVSARGARLSRTPPMRPGDHTTRARTRVTIAADGTISGTTETTATGVFAVSARNAMLAAQQQGSDRAAETTLARLGTPGTGRFEAAAISELKDPYVVRSSFTLKERLAVPLRGNRRTPFGLPVHARPGTALMGPRRSERTEPFVCLAGRQIEEIDIEFAPELALPRRQPPRSVEGPGVTFRATQVLEERTLRIRREFTSSVPGQVCEPEMEPDLAEAQEEILEHVGVMLQFGGQ